MAFACYLTIASKFSMMAFQRISNIKDSKPMAYIFIGCFLIYILLSQAMSVFSRTAEIDKLEKEVAIVKKEKNDLQNEVSLLNDDDYVTRYARENYVFTKDGEQVVILPDIDQEK